MILVSQTISITQKVSKMDNKGKQHDILMVFLVTDDIKQLNYLISSI